MKFLHEIIGDLFDHSIRFAKWFAPRSLEVPDPGNKKIDQRTS
jgi:hypothetical protein